MGKTAIQIRADLRTDLKDSGALWSNDELNRCIERAVADFNRYLPDEKTYELSLQLTVTSESVAFPAAIDADRIVDGADIAATADGDKLTIAAQPDVPRPLTLTITDTNASITNLSLIIRGSDRDGKALEETLHYYKGLGVVAGKKYFKTVNEVEVDQIDGNGAADILDLGIGAYTDVWVYLANAPVKADSETGTDAASASIARNTDYYIDYIEGRVKAISGGLIAAAEVCTFSYTKMQVGIDLSGLAGLIRVQRIEYPVDSVPQNFIQGDTFGKKLFITGMGEAEEQQQMAEDEHIRVYYDAEHIAPNDYAPGTIPDFLENTVLLAAAAYALYIYALKNEHQALTDMTSARTDLASANTEHTALATALTNIKKYLDNNSAADAAGLLAAITADAANLRTAIATALSALKTYTDAVATDLTSADAVRANYMGATANYVDAATAPGIKKYLDDGDAFLNTIPIGGEQQVVPEAYALYARIVREALVTPHEQDRQFYLDNALRRTNAAMSYANEAAQRLSNLSSYIEQSAGYVAISATFAREAEARLAKIAAYMQEANQYVQTAANDLSMGDRFRNEADERRNEAYSIWRDRKQYIGDFTAGAVRQMPTYK